MVCHVSSLNWVKLYKGFYSIVVINTLITVFELLFYIYVINPTVTTSIKYLLENKVVDLSLEAILVEYCDLLQPYGPEGPHVQSLCRNITELALDEMVVAVRPVSDFYLGLIAIVKERETGLYTEINNGCYYVIATEVGLLLVLMVYMRHKLHSINVVDLGDVHLSSVVIVLLIVLFQVLFYYFGTKYNYVGSEEIVHLVLSTYAGA